jgi:hypothetical protein
LRFERYIADNRRPRPETMFLCAPARIFQSSGQGAGERTFLMAKQLTFKKAQRDGCAIHLHKCLTLEMPWNYRATVAQLDTAA